MSSKSSRKPKAISLKPTTPRSLEELQKEYADLLSKAAQAQYMVYVHNKELEALNEQLVRVNQEAAHRQSLDKKTPDTEVSNGQS